MIRARSTTVVAALAAAATLSAVLAACSSSSSTGSSKAAGSSTGTASTAVTAAVPGLPDRFKSGINVASGVYPPMEFLDSEGGFTGFDYDLGQAIAQKLGTRMTFATQDFDTIIPSLQSGKHQIIMFGMNDTLEREKTLDYVDYFHAGMAILVKKGNPDKISTVLDLCGKTVAVAKATVQATLMKTESAKCAGTGNSAMTITELPAEGDAMLAVRAGKATADVFDAAPAESAATTSGDGKLFEVVHDTQHATGYNPVYTGIGVLKKDHDLTVALQAALSSLIADGTYQQLLSKYQLSSYAVQSAQLNQAS